MGLSQPGSDLPMPTNWDEADHTPSNLAKELLELEEMIRECLANEESTMIALQQAQNQYDAAVAERIKWCQKRNTVLHHLADFIMPEYEPTNMTVKSDSGPFMQHPIRVPEATWEGRDK